MQNNIAKQIEFKIAKFRPPIMYKIEDIQTITIGKTYYARIPISIELLAELEIDGKLKTIMLSQSMSTKMIQELYNELENVLKDSIRLKK